MKKSFFRGVIDLNCHAFKIPGFGILEALPARLAQVMDHLPAQARYDGNRYKKTFSCLTNISSLSSPYDIEA